MSAPPDELRRHLLALLAREGVVLTDRELALLVAQYPTGGSQGRWDVREYAGRVGLGSREYRVVRGTGVREVYRSPTEEIARAVRTALNELESPDGDPPLSPTEAVWK